MQIAVRHIKEAKNNGYEAEIANYETIYDAALVNIGEKTVYTIDDCKPLLNLARAYLETSSKWDQEFLHQMGKVEMLVEGFVAPS